MYHLIVLISFICCVKCGCYESYMTFCDDLSDIHSEDIKTWREVVIGSIDKAQNKYVINKTSIELSRFRRLKTLIIIGQVREITSNTFYIFKGDTRLETINFYGNDIRRLKYNSFDTMHLKQFTFRKNNLEYIQKNAFYQCEFESIDLSENNLEQIEDGILSDPYLNNSTRELILKNNRLTVIGHTALPTRLEILDLSNNNLDHLSPVQFKNLLCLEELNLSHNGLKSFSVDISPNRYLHIIDLSFNSIVYVNFKNFNNLTLLEVLDLSHNKISYAGALKDFKFPKRGQPLQLSLAFNHFTQLAFVNDTSWVDQLVIFYGNPWNCLCWEKMDKYITEHKVRRHECDLEFFGTGQTPYCLYYDNNDEFDCDNSMPKKNQFTDQELKNFLKVIKDNEKNIVCNLSPIIY